MSRFKLVSILAATAFATGCGQFPQPFETDGTPEAELVRAWLSQGWPASRRPGALIEPEAQLTMSDYGVPLTQSNVRARGPDRLPGCERSTLERRGSSVVATWSCPAGTDLAFRTVYFEVRNGRIASANHTEAYQAVRGR